MKKMTVQAVFVMAGVLAIGAVPAGAATQVKFHDPVKGHIRVVEQQVAAVAQQATSPILGSKGQVIGWRQTAAIAQAKAIVCDGCAGSLVKERVTLGKLTKYVERRKMQCGDCTSAFANLLATGKLQHTCTTCGNAAACQLAQGPDTGGYTVEHRRD